MPAPIGQRVADEFARRGLTGSFFSYQDSLALKQIASLEELQQFFEVQGFPAVVVSEDAGQVVDSLVQQQRAQGPLEWLLLVGDWVLLGIPRLMATAVGRRRHDESRRVG